MNFKRTWLSDAEPKRRLYKSGMRWAFWRWTLTPSGYITRLHLVKTPWGAIMVHFLNSPDPEPHLHDHPVTFLSIIVHGWYTELRQRQEKLPKGWMPRARCIYRRWFNFIRASSFDRHRIIQVAPGTITVCLVGPKTREWGFWTDEGWIPWRMYNKKYGTTWDIQYKYLGAGLYEVWLEKRRYSEDR